MNLVSSLHCLIWKDCLQIKYLGEEGENTPVAGAVAVCSPWDLLVSILI